VNDFAKMVRVRGFVWRSSKLHRSIRIVKDSSGQDICFHIWPVISLPDTSNRIPIADLLHNVVPTLRLLTCAVRKE